MSVESKEYTICKGFGTTELNVRQSISTFIDMSKKTIVEFSRYPIAFVAMFAQIFLMILMFMFAAMMFMSSSEPSSNMAPLVGVMIYGFIINMFLSFIIWEIGFSLREEQFRGTLESLYLSPANKISNLVSRIFAILIWTSLMCILAVVAVSYILGGLPAENLLVALGILFFTISGCLGIGLVFAAVTLKLKETAALLVNFLQFFFMIFCAMFFPFSALPDVVRNNISRYIPVSYCVDAFRSVLIGLPEGYPELMPLNIEILIVTAFGIITPIVGYFLYKRIEKIVKIDGSLGEY